MRVLNDSTIAAHFLGVCGVLVALKTSGFDTRNMLGNIVASVPNTSSDIPCKATQRDIVDTSLSSFYSQS
jgi:hypothetical protein